MKEKTPGQTCSQVLVFGIPLVDLVLILALAGLTSWANLTWAARNAAPPHSDANTHAWHSLVFHESLDDSPGPRSTRSLVRFFNYQGHYPPLAYQVGELGWIALGRSALALVLGLAPFLLLLAVSMYGLGRLLAGRMAGLLAAVLTCTAPVVLDHSRMLFLDLTLTALVAFGTWTLLASHSFQDLRYSRAWGVALGLGMLTKWTFLVFLAVPLGAAVCAAFRARRPRDSEIALGMLALALLLAQIALLCFPLRPESLLAVWGLALLGCALGIVRLRRDLGSDSALVNAAEALIPALALAAPYYACSQDLVLDKITYQAGVQVELIRTLGLNLREQALWFYLSAPWWPLGPLLGLIRRETRPITLQLLGSLVLSTLFAALIPHDPRYLMPNLPALVALGMMALRGVPRFAATVLTVAVAVGVFQATCHLGTALGKWPSLNDRRQMSLVQPPWLPPLPFPPLTGAYPVEALLERMTWNQTEAQTTVFVAASPTETANFQARSLVFYARLQGHGLRLWELGHDWGNEPLPSPGQVHNYLLVYRHPDALEEDRVRNQIEGPITRQELLDRARQEMSFPKGLRTLKTFRFGQSTVVELLEPEPSSPRPSPRPADGTPALPEGQPTH